MNRREAIFSGAAVVAAMAAPGQLIAATRRSDRLLVLADPAIDASQAFASLFGGSGAHVITLDRNRLVTWHEEIAPRLGARSSELVGLTHAADASFFIETGREMGLRPLSAWLHRRKAGGFDHNELKGATARFPARRFDQAGLDWIGQAAMVAAGDHGRWLHPVQKLPEIEQDVRDLLSWKIA